MSRILRATHGQASLEWVAIVALVAGVVAVAAALSQGVYVGRTITRQWARALCIVRAGDCWRDKEPCVLRSKDERKGVAVHVFLVKLGGGRRALVEERSDGSVAVTEVHDWTGGFEVSEGASFTFKAAGLDAQVGAQLEASIAGRIGRGKTWIVGSRADADGLVDDLRHHRAVPAPDASTSETRTESHVGGSLGAGADGMEVDGTSAGWSGSRLAGSRADRRTGHRTLFVQWSWDASASAANGVLGASRSAVGDVYGVELDERGRPIDLQVLNAGSVADGLPTVASPAAGMLAPNRAARGAVYEVTSHLDLTDRHNLMLARSVVEEIQRGHTPSASSVQALRRRIDEQGTVEARILNVESSTGGSALSGTFEGLRVGYDASSETKEMELQAAASRGLDGHWLPRDDCLTRA